MQSMYGTSSAAGIPRQHQQSSCCRRRTFSGNGTSRGCVLVAAACGRRAAGAAAALPPGLEDIVSGTPEQAYNAAAAVHSSSGSSLGGGLGGPLLQQATQLLLTALAYATVAWPQRPRGWCERRLVEVRRSTVTGAGLGVFAAAPIPAGTVLGAYPGRPRGVEEMESKAERAPGARQWCFLTRSGRYLDPTDGGGGLSARPSPGLPWLLACDPTCALINEPPPGAPGGANVVAEDDPGDADSMLCVAARAIAAGEELFLDYGRSYDRRGYRQAQRKEGEA